MSNAARLLLCTCPDQETAQRLATTLVEDRLAACINLVPGITSIYRWQGRIHQDPEVLLLLKTADERVDALMARLRALHPYEVPEIIVLPIVAGLAEYLEWVKTCVTSKQGS
ncbi:divalent-cation tolerance protein CutA [Caldichromatium japonicum]|uniref:Divalent-cation tolerance protein CutA n=1 Tax=Caldichromatium japonicum TaxID=2699430 RepID=A0A6G7VDV6_9GAMM|nr:divalent-cation tolerance protein CutA [Caldichromatium japonicum]QIK38090.1 divalent-cation tolerance protein CutA [Caldichromatium japonicum]